MKIGIDISQLAYKNTGVAVYLRSLVENLLKIDKKNEYILFYSSLRRKIDPEILGLKSKGNVKIKAFDFPPTAMDILWNKFHIMPIEKFVGNVDLFITSDWTEPPVKAAKKVTILYDLIVYTKPEETDKKIVQTQRKKLEWVKKESNIVFCISEATKQDAIKILGIDEKKLKVIYPGI